MVESLLLKLQNRKIVAACTAEHRPATAPPPSKSKASAGTLQRAKVTLGRQDGAAAPPPKCSDSVLINSSKLAAQVGTSALTLLWRPVKTQQYD